MGMCRSRTRLRAARLRALLSLALAACWVTAPVPAAAKLTCSQIPGIIDAFSKYHVVHRQRSEEIEQRAIDTYFKRLDPSRALFLEFEIEVLRASMAGIFEAIDAGDCSRLLRLHQNLVARQAKIENSVRAIASAEDFELDPSVTWVLDPDQRGYPTTEEERAELLRSRIHFQISNYLSAGEPLDDAKRRLTHRYASTPSPHRSTRTRTTCRRRCWRTSGSACRCRSRASASPFPTATATPWRNASSPAAQRIGTRASSRRTRSSR
jgi:hypothetical protein